MKKTEIFGVGIKSIASSITSQRRVNCFYEIRQDGEKETLVIRWTPGLTLYVTLPTFPIRGMVEAGNYLYVVSGNTIYQICYNGGFLNVGTINSSTATPVSMAINESQVLIVDGTTGYLFDYQLLVNDNSVTINNLITETVLLKTLTNLTGNA